MLVRQYIGRIYQGTNAVYDSASLHATDSYTALLCFRIPEPSGQGRPSAVLQVHQRLRYPGQIPWEGGRRKPQGPETFGYTWGTSANCFCCCCFCCCCEHLSNASSRDEQSEALSFTWTWLDYIAAYLRTSFNFISRPVLSWNKVACVMNN